MLQIDFISKKDARRQVAETLKQFVKSNEAKIKAMLAREAEGMAKLEKSGGAKRNGGSGMDSDSSWAQRRNLGLTSSVGDAKLGGMADGRLRGETNPDSFSPGAAQKNGRNSYKSEPGMQKDALPDTTGMALAAPPMSASAPMAPPVAPPVAPPANLCFGCGGGDTEPLGNHNGLDHYMCRDCGEVGVTIKEENEQASQNQAQDALAAMASQSLSPMIKKDPNDTSEDQRENQPKDETEKAYKAAWLSQKKDIKKAAMPMGAKPMGKSVEAIRQAAGMMGGTTPKMPSVKAPTVPITSAAAPQKDAFNTGGMNPTTQAAMGKAEKDPSKKPFNTGEGHGGVPLKEVPNTEVAQESAREGAVPPPLEGGKEIPAPGSGGQIKKTNMKKGEMAPTPLCKVSDIRNRAAAKHAAKRQQVASDVKAIAAVSNAVQPGIQKADTIPSAPAAPGAGAVKAPPAKMPASSPAQTSSPTPPKL